MKKGFITAYSIVAFMVLAVALAWFCVSVFSEASRGSEEAERTFSWLCRETAQNSYSLGFMSDAYIERTTDLCRGVSTLIAITISSPTETFYAWPENSPVLANTEGKGPEIQRSSLFSKVMDAGVDMGANASPAIRVTAALRTLSPSVIFAASRNSFILVFLVLLSSIIVLLAMPAQAKITQATEENGKDKSDFSEESESADYGYDYGYIEENEASNVSGIEDEQPESDFAHDSAAESESSQQAESFLQTGGLGLEQHLEERLNEELVRAASVERDVSILILRVFGMDCSNEDFRGIAKILADLFKRGDLIFEFGADALACIIPSAGLDETMQAAEHLYGLVRDFLSENSLDNRVCIGISTRMTRTLPASRMIREADTAMRKAEEEERLPIVAFRANPEKYKDYIAKNPSEANG